LRSSKAFLSFQGTCPVSEVCCGYQRCYLCPRSDLLPMSPVCTGDDRSLTVAAQNGRFRRVRDGLLAPEHAAKEKQIEPDSKRERGDDGDQLRN
jgi:hypothetical protein